MKNLVLYAIVMMLLFSTASCSSSHYVSTRPETAVYSRPAPPSPNYMWVDGGYRWRGGRYMYKPGYWAAPRRTRIYQPGAWVSTPRGYYWRRGGWRR